MLNNKSAAELAADLFILIIKPIIVLQHTKKRPHPDPVRTLDFFVL